MKKYLDMKIRCINYFFNALFILFLTCFQFCKNKELTPIDPPVSVNPPRILTNDAIEISDSSAICGASILCDDSSRMQSWGLCLSTFSKADLFSGTIVKEPFFKSFSLKMRGLKPGTKYFLRAFAIWNDDTLFGNEINFSTADLSDIGGNTYKSIVIGTQVWMKENLRTRLYRNGDSIKYGLSNKVWESNYHGACSDYRNDPQYSKVNGLIYNGYATVDPRGICPNGWHLPDMEEWMVLLDYLGGPDISGGKMKSTGSRDKGDGLWLPPNSFATNSSGFTALPAGHRNPDGTYHEDGNSAFWWARSNIPGYHKSATIGLKYYAEYSMISDELHQNGLSLRCVKD